MIQKLKFLHVIFSYATVIIGCHEMHSTPEKEFQYQVVLYYKEKKFQMNRFQNNIPQPIIYFNSICDGIVIVCGPGTETYSLLIKTLQTITNNMVKAFNKTKAVVRMLIQLLHRLNKHYRHPEKASTPRYEPRMPVVATTTSRSLNHFIKLKRSLEKMKIQMHEVKPFLVLKNE